MASFLQTSDGDIAIPNGRAQLVKGDQEKLQKIINRLRLFKGEWFLNINSGIPYWQKIFVGKNPDLEVVRQIFRRAILTVEGILSVTLDLSLNPDRTLVWSFVAKTDENTEISGNSQAFVDGADQ